MKTGGFILREFHGIRYYSCKAFEGIPQLGHGFSTRGGESRIAQRSLNLSYFPWDSAERVHGNQQRFLLALNLANARLATLHQVHSNRVHMIEDNFPEWNQLEGDALITAIEGIALAVKVADCLPILIADPSKRAVAAVHSGWRGALSGILLCTIREMRKHYGSCPADLLVAVGPGIRGCCFEVGCEVVELFEAEYPASRMVSPVEDRPGKYLLDLCKVLDAQLDSAGVPKENRHDLGECTHCNTDRYFSYRAEGLAAGRMMAVIGLIENSNDPSVVNR